jgi:hypothetical protein
MDGDGEGSLADVGGRDVVPEVGRELARAV